MVEDAMDDIDDMNFGKKKKKNKNKNKQEEAAQAGVDA